MSKINFSDTKFLSLILLGICLLSISENVKFIDVSDTKCKGKIIYGGYHGITLTKCFSEKDPRSKEIIKYLDEIFK